MRYIVFVFTIIIEQGCTFPVPSYHVSASNQKILENAAIQVSVVHDESDSNDTGWLLCRLAGPVKLGAGETFSEYIVNALKEELRKSGKLNDQGNKQIVAKIKRIDFSSALGATNWYIDATYKISGKDISISTVHNDRSAWIALRACHFIAWYFTKAVEVHLSQLYKNQTFQDELGIVSPSDPAVPDVESRLLQLNRLRESGLISEEEFSRKRIEILGSL